MPERPNFQVLSLHFDGGGGTGGSVVRAELRSRQYQVRRSHAKSKAGCLGCKVKRVKCDEGKPSCRRCLRNQSLCIYRQPNIPSPGTDGQLSQDRLYTAHLPALDGPVYGAPRTVLLHHLCASFGDVYGLDGGDPYDFVTLGLARPFLLDTLLALSACHLRHHAAEPSAYRVAEHHQQWLALRGFQAALRRRDLDQITADALLVTSMMLNMLSFPLPASARGTDVEPEASWVFGTDERRCDWMAMCLGMKPLLMATEAFRADSCLRWMYEASDEGPLAEFSHGLTPNAIPPSWSVFFALDDDAPATKNLYYEPVRALALVRHLPPGTESFFLYVSFFGKVDAGFRTLIEKQDTRAMWLLGFWFGLLSRYNFWWMRERVGRDYRAIVRWMRIHSETGMEGCPSDVWEQMLHDLEFAPYWYPGQHSLYA